MGWHGVRITKYDPGLRDERGAFTGDDWTSVSDVGESFAGEVLTFAHYVAIEGRHVEAVATFLEEAGVERLTLAGVELVPDWADGVPGFREGDSLDRLGALDRLRLMLREEMSARLEAPTLYCHVGYDYYLYVGTTTPCPRSVGAAREVGLFVDEDFVSPQLESA
jgi:hypothetical protein